MVSRRRITRNNRRTRKCGDVRRKKRSTSRSRTATKRRRINRKSRIAGGKRDIFIITAFGSALNKNKEAIYRKRMTDEDKVKTWGTKKGQNGYDKPMDIVTTITKLDVEDPIPVLERMSNNFTEIDEFLERGKQGMRKQRPEPPIYREIMDIQNRVPPKT